MSIRTVSARLVQSDPKNGLEADFNPTSSYKVVLKSRLKGDELVVAEIIVGDGEAPMVMIEVKKVVPPPPPVKVVPPVTIRKENRSVGTGVRRDS